MAVLSAFWTKGAVPQAIVRVSQSSHRVSCQPCIRTPTLLYSSPTIAPVRMVSSNTSKRPTKAATQQQQQQKQRQRQQRPLQAANSSNSTKRNSQFTYSVAASYIGKGRAFDPNTHVFHFNPYHRLQQRPAEGDRRAVRPESGQDAFFVSRVGDTGAVALAVADGVGGWMESGVDPADFSHGLCENMAASAHDHGRADTPAVPAPRKLMQDGYDAVLDDGAVAAGGSTAVVGVLTSDGSLEVANLGDSGFLQLRPNAVHAGSVPQTHGFNTPFQLSKIPPSILARMALFGGAQLSDQPRDAEVTRHDLQHGDVLVFASDGVWDNLFNQDLLRLVSRAMTASGAWRATEHAGLLAADPSYLRELTNRKEDVEAAAAADGDAVEAKTEAEIEAEAEANKANHTLQSIIATHITAAARRASVDTELNGPFAKEVKRYYPYDPWSGGKVDDICVVVVVVHEEPLDGEDNKPLKSRL